MKIDLKMHLFIKSLANAKFIVRPAYFITFPNILSRLPITPFSSI